MKRNYKTRQEQHVSGKYYSEYYCLYCFDKIFPYVSNHLLVYAPEANRSEGLRRRL